MCKYWAKRLIALCYKIKYIGRTSIKVSSTIISSEFEGSNRIGKNNYLKKCYIGKHTYCGDNDTFYNAHIGRYCSIGSDIKLIWSKHPIDYVSTSSFFYKHNCIEEEYKNSNGFCLEVGNDVWIGDNVLLKGGITIGDGAIIGLGAVVTRDVPPYAIVGGNPAKIIKYRFDERTIDELLKIKWWDYNNKQLQEYYSLFSNVQDFVDIVGNK